jgi:hypothetical protein
LLADSNRTFPTLSSFPAVVRPLGPERPAEKI